MAQITTSLTRLLKIRHPILLAGMDGGGPTLAAAVSNAGGLGILGGVGYYCSTSDIIDQITALKSKLKDENCSFGVDFKFPPPNSKNGGKFEEGLIDTIIHSKPKLFATHSEVTPQIVAKFHAAGIPVMNTIHSPDRVLKALEVGVDIICAKGDEGGGHTIYGGLATSVLVPAVVDLCKHSKSPLTGEPVSVVAAGGVFDGRGIVAALCWGAQAVCIGTRFLASKEAITTPANKQAILDAGYHDTVCTSVVTGTPLRVVRNAYIKSWEDDSRKEQLNDMLSKGNVPLWEDTEKLEAEGFYDFSHLFPVVAGQAVGAIKEVKSAADIVEEMMVGATAVINSLSKL